MTFSMQREELLLSLLPLAVCPPGFFGKRCEEQCDCVHGLSCHHQTGACRCDKGWRGKHCDKRECPLGAENVPPGPRAGDGILSLPSFSTGLVWRCSQIWVQQIRWRGVTLQHPAPCPNKNHLPRCSLLARSLRRRLCPAVPVSHRYPLPPPDGRVRLSSGIHRLWLREK